MINKYIYIYLSIFDYGWNIIFSGHPPSPLLPSATSSPPLNRRHEKSELSRGSWWNPTYSLRSPALMTAFFSFLYAVLKASTANFAYSSFSRTLSSSSRALKSFTCAPRYFFSLASSIARPLKPAVLHMETCSSESEISSFS